MTARRYRKEDKLCRQLDVMDSVRSVGFLSKYISV
jgi:hypothetical protein